MGLPQLNGVKSVDVSSAQSSLTPAVTKKRELPMLLEEGNVLGSLNFFKEVIPSWERSHIPHGKKGK